MLRIAFYSVLSILVCLIAARQMSGQTVSKRTPEQIKELYDQHQGDFDYLLGDWEFSVDSKAFGKSRGFWSAVRLAEGAQILDEYRIVSPSGEETLYAISTLRAYNAVLDQWELVTAESGTGLQNVGTARRVGSEMHIDQKFDVMSAKPRVSRIRYYQIKPDSFSWTADWSFDGGKTWEVGSVQLWARRIGPPRFLGQLAPSKKPAKVRSGNPL